MVCSVTGEGSCIALVVVMVAVIVAAAAASVEVVLYMVAVLVQVVIANIDGTARLGCCAFGVKAVNFTAYRIHTMLPDIFGTTRIAILQHCHPYDLSIVRKWQQCYKGELAQLLILKTS